MVHSHESPHSLTHLTPHGKGMETSLYLRLMICRNMEAVLFSELTALLYVCLSGGPD